MQIQSYSLDAGTCRIALNGRMDVQGARETDLMFGGLIADKRAVIVDMSAVTFLSSLGIRTLLSTAKAVARRNGKMVLLDPTPGIAKKLELAGIDTLVPICSSLDEARSVVSQGRATLEAIGRG